MIGALAFEWVRIRTLRSTYWLSGVAIALSALIAGLITYFSDREGEFVDEMVPIVLTGGVEFTPLPFLPLLMGILGAFAFGHEYRHNLILATLAAVPRRVNLVIAKVLVVGLWAAAAAVVSVCVNWMLTSALVGEGQPLLDDPVGPVVFGFVGYTVLWGELGLGLGMLIRNLPATLVIMLVVPLIVEPLAISLIAFIETFEGIRGAIHVLPVQLREVHGRLGVRGRRVVRRRGRPRRAEPR